MSGQVRSKVRRRRRLTKHQREVAAEFISNPPPRPPEQSAYEAGWRNSLAYEALNDRQTPADELSRQEHDRALRRLSHKIVPANQQAAAASRSEIIKAARHHLRECGGVESFNISAFVRDIQSRPKVGRVYRGSTEPKPLGDHAIRVILKDHLDIEGRPGRPKNQD